MLSNNNILHNSTFKTAAKIRWFILHKLSISPKKHLNYPKTSIFSTSESIKSRKRQFPSSTTMKGIFRQINHKKQRHSTSWVGSHNIMPAIERSWLSMAGNIKVEVKWSRHVYRKTIHKRGTSSFSPAIPIEASVLYSLGEVFCVDILWAVEVCDGTRHF